MLALTGRLGIKRATTTHIDRAEKMTEGLSLPNVNVENTSPPIERSPQALGEDSNYETQRLGVSSDPDNEVPIYVKGWRLQCLALG